MCSEIRDTKIGNPYDRAVKADKNRLNKQDLLKGLSMQIEQSSYRTGTGERCSGVLYWAAWCFLGVNIFVNILSLLAGNWPEQWSIWTILASFIRQNFYHIYYMFVLFGLSAILKVGNAIARQLSTSSDFVSRQA